MPSSLVTKVGWKINPHVNWLIYPCVNLVRDWWEGHWEGGRAKQFFPLWYIEERETGGEMTIAMRSYSLLLTSLPPSMLTGSDMDLMLLRQELTVLSGFLFLLPHHSNSSCQGSDGSSTLAMPSMASMPLSPPAATISCHDHTASQIGDACRCRFSKRHPCQACSEKPRWQL